MSEEVPLADFLAENNLNQALESLKIFGASQPCDVLALKEEDIEKMREQEEAPLKKLVAKKLQSFVLEKRLDLLDLTVPLPFASGTSAKKHPPGDFTEGFEAADYCGKWYRCQIVGFDVEGHGGTNEDGGSIKQMREVPPGGCRFLVHYEGWIPKWDEYVVLPTEASRFRSFPSNPSAALTGNSREPHALLGSVPAIRVKQPSGEERRGAVVAISKEHEGDSFSSDGWGGLHFMILVRYAGGGSDEEWIDMCDEADRSRLVVAPVYKYSSP
mmetsp:Transcript_36765/g.75383  ORF Transcript_36765/g.75383 Transcript_36765/m.75383 type:complete len:271 (-) Transcript_36765:163-975(-)|eukprot:CAMPEP_0181292924 /NCGR_PEP_ID=MMETSP1101-20121128/2780_1 /TAXON_ID=46948 /ORGANISM="Rhodomonas abbreviata, Strain Caron Lab Isolate" /LENGTH=270 /DNA_ID=CAMNT_0023397455 /DNA_START=102 /DNA_END=914 /DNA_ORIENTATION=-